MPECRSYNLSGFYRNVRPAEMRPIEVEHLPVSYGELCFCESIAAVPQQHSVVITHKAWNRRLAVFRAARRFIRKRSVTVAIDDRVDLFLGWFAEKKHD